LFGDATGMIQVYIVGTDHDFQKGQEPYRQEAFEFRQYIKEVCLLSHVEAIGEEMNREALTEAGVQESTCEILSHEIGLRHCLCDPDKATRQALGIRSSEEIVLEGTLKNWKPKTIKKILWEEARKREPVWACRMEECHNHPVLFVCGANHVKSFSYLLRSKGLHLKIMSRDWAPNKALHWIAETTSSQ
jgi:hypothetical protein